MTKLFSPVQLGTLALPNRLVRSATAERMADVDGRPKPSLVSLMRGLAQGGVGLRAKADDEDHNYDPKQDPDDE